MLVQLNKMVVGVGMWNVMILHWFNFEVIYYEICEMGFGGYMVKQMSLGHMKIHEERPWSWLCKIS
jgi:hypothetical protein